MLLYSNINTNIDTNTDTNNSDGSSLRIRRILTSKNEEPLPDPETSYYGTITPTRDADIDLNTGTTKLGKSYEFDIDADAEKDVSTKSGYNETVAI